MCDLSGGIGTSSDGKIESIENGADFFQAPCGHNYCLACFRRWAKQEQKACPTCRAKFPRTFINTPRVNTLLVDAIRLFKAGDKKSSKKEAKPFVRLDDQSRPSEAFQTERSRRNGIANAASGRIFVNVANDWFGPILSEHDPTNHRVRIGRFSEERWIVGRLRWRLVQQSYAMPSIWSPFSTRGWNRWASASR